MMRKTALVVALLLAPAMLHAERRPASPPPLPEEAIPAVETLPADYPDSWVLVQDFHFDAIVDGRLAIVDTANEQ